MDLGDDYASIRKLWRFASAAQKFTNLSTLRFQLRRQLKESTFRPVGFFGRAASHTGGEGIAEKQQ